MKICLCCNPVFADEVCEVAKMLENNGHIVSLPATVCEELTRKGYDYDAVEDKIARLRDTDAVLVCNILKNCTPGYIDAGLFAEMSIARYLDKPVYTLFPLPDNEFLKTELEQLNIKVLNSDFVRIMEKRWNAHEEREEREARPVEPVIEPIVVPPAPIITAPEPIVEKTEVKPLESTEDEEVKLDDSKEPLKFPDDLKPEVKEDIKNIEEENKAVIKDDIAANSKESKEEDAKEEAKLVFPKSFEVPPEFPMPSESAANTTKTSEELAAEFNFKAPEPPVVPGNATGMPPLPPELPSLSSEPAGFTLPKPVHSVFADDLADLKKEEKADGLKSFGSKLRSGFKKFANFCSGKPNQD